MTFSIAARCPDTGMIGMAVASSSPAVAARCAHVRAGVGAIASQNITDPALGQDGLALMALGASAAQARDVLVGNRPTIAFRQLALIDAQGRTAVFSGAATLGIHATAEGPGAVAAGNLLAHDGVPAMMIRAFAASTGHLGSRLVAAMAAGLQAGGEAGPVHSAGLMLAHDVSWPVADLRVDWTDDDPIAGLSDLWALYQPQLLAYVDRAVAPDRAPRYGVPGEG